MIFSNDKTLISTFYVPCFSCYMMCQTLTVTPAIIQGEYSVKHRSFFLIRSFKKRKEKCSKKNTKFFKIKMMTPLNSPGKLCHTAHRLMNWTCSFSFARAQTLEGWFKSVCVCVSPVASASADMTGQ